MNVFFRKKSIDIHTHCYLPAYMNLLRSRKNPPRIVSNHKSQDRLIILPEEMNDPYTSLGRPISSEYWNSKRKLAYMDMHNIDISLLSLANPWIDFLMGDEASLWANRLNEDMNNICSDNSNRFFGLGILPVQNLKACLQQIEQISQCSRLKGVILGTFGLGKGLNDPELLTLYHALSEHNLLLFIHPHYGIEGEYCRGFGHSLHLTLGFTFETTIAITKFILSGFLDQLPKLKLILAHSGGTLPFLAGRLDNCVKHDYNVVNRLKYRPSYYLRRFNYDATCYYPSSLECTINLVGYDKIMFGTDHPFFPPLNLFNRQLNTTPWESCIWNYKTIESFSSDVGLAIKRNNAELILNIDSCN